MCAERWDTCKKKSRKKQDHETFGQQIVAIHYRLYFDHTSIVDRFSRREILVAEMAWKAACYSGLYNNLGRIPIYFLASCDLGRPNRISISSTIKLDFGRNNEETQDSVPIQPSIYRDIEDDNVHVETEVPPSGGKTRADSP